MQMPHEALRDGTDDLLAVLLDAPAPKPQLREIGKVAEIGDGIAIVAGLARALVDELLDFGGGLFGIVFDLEQDRLGVVLLGPSGSVVPGSDVQRTDKVISVPVGDALLGRVVDALGRPRDGNGPIATDRESPIEVAAPSILDRRPVTRPLATGLNPAYSSNLVFGVPRGRFVALGPLRCVR
jgi:F-type H+-transporting ATPase subunit alpha